MLKLTDLTPTQRTNYEATLVSSHRVGFRVDIFDQNEAYLSTIADPSAEQAPGGYAVESGQVDVDADAQVTRAATLSIIDPDRKFVWDAAAPANGLWYSRFLGIGYCVYVEDDPDDWVQVPVFFGPVQDMDRSGEFVEIKASGKEVLLQPPTFIDLSAVQGLQYIDYRQAVLTLFQNAGETKFRLSSHTGNFYTVTTVLPPNRRIRYPGGTVTTVVAEYLPNPFSGEEGKSPNANAWELLRQAADKQNLSLHYDAEGFLVLEVKGDNGGPARWTFREGDGGSVISRPRLDESLAAFINEVHVTADGWPTVYKAALEPGHSLSKESLSRNGRQRTMLEVVEVGPETSESNASTVASSRLKEADLLRIQATFDSLVIPHLEQNDVVRIETSFDSRNFLLRKFTIPLTVGDTMSIGFNERILSAGELTLSEAANPNYVKEPGPANAHNPLDPGAPYMPGEVGGPPMPTYAASPEAKGHDHHGRKHLKSQGVGHKHHGGWHVHA